MTVGAERMLVYGNHTRVVPTDEALDTLTASCERLVRTAVGLERHAALTAAFLDASELAQGVLDALHERCGRDVWTPLSARVLDVPMALARALLRSHQSRHREIPLPRHMPLEALRSARLPAELRVRVPEGFAFYAVYPESYLEAAKHLPCDRPVQIVGIRSIGTGLACAVAATLGHLRPPLTVRPGGDPFARTVELSRGALRRLLANSDDADFAIVDEGPGFSGSSFGSVADLLESRGIEPSRIHFLPSHPGMPGARASERHRVRWIRAHRHVASFEATFLKEPCRLTEWFEDLTGPGVLEEIGAGRWRALRFRNRRDWPAVAPHLERRKFLLRGERGDWLLKFAGLGRYGERTFALARRLADAGFAPEVTGLRHGFLVQRWHGDARSVVLDDGAQRTALLRRLESYLAFRARDRERPGAGASPETLLAMAKHNTSVALGEAAAEPIGVFRGLLAEVRRGTRPVRIDGRMLPFEWLRLPDRRLLKTDGVDHHCGHDLVGCQDIAWDVVGAMVELGLDGDERERLARSVARATGRPLTRAILQFNEVCYLAFRLGHSTLAAAITESSMPAEAERLRLDARRYGRLLASALHRL